MRALLTAALAALALHAAPARATECFLAFEASDTDHKRTEEAVRTALGRSTGCARLRLDFGRIAHYPWLSTLVAREASSSIVWDAAAGRARGETERNFVAAVLRRMPEFTALFASWSIVSVAVADVRLKPVSDLSLPAGQPLPPSAKLPWDAALVVTLRQP